MNIVKCLTVKFIDGSEIDVYNTMNATITKSTTHLAYTIWKTATKDKELRQFHLAFFQEMVTRLDKKYKIVVSIVDWHLEERKEIEKKINAQIRKAR